MLRPTTIGLWMVIDNLSFSLAALADPTRRAILDRLTRRSASVNELARPFKMSQQAVSKHLALLERAKLIQKRRAGRRSICTLDPAPFREITDWIESSRRFWEQSFDHLDVVLAEMKKEKRYARTRK